MIHLRIRSVRKTYGQEAVLEGVSCELEAGATLSVLGRSGAGKSTLLKIIAGLEQADEGSIEIGGREVSQEPPQARNAVYLYQEPLLFPHLSAYENVAFGLRIRRRSKQEIATSVETMLVALGLEAHATKMPDQLSGGQRQRVAFGRAIIVGPALLLLDEPFGALDPTVRSEMQDLFRSLSHRFQMTTVLVTHDLKEALAMGDRMSLLRDGQLRTFDSAAGFMEDPESGVQEELAFWRRITKEVQ